MIDKDEIRKKKHQNIEDILEFSHKKHNKNAAIVICEDEKSKISIMHKLRYQ